MGREPRPEPRGAPAFKYWRKGFLQRRTGLCGKENKEQEDAQKQRKRMSQAAKRRDSVQYCQEDKMRRKLSMGFRDTEVTSGLSKNCVCNVMGEARLGEQVRRWGEKAGASR